MGSPSGASAAPVVRATSLTKTYRHGRGVVDLEFEVEPGEVFGFLGPNGAGKTTTIRLMLDLIRPTSGRIEVLGSEPGRDVALRRRIGYLPGDVHLDERLTPRELLTYLANLRALEGLGRAPELADRFELELDRPIHALSKGNRQKVGLVQALMHDPELLILDEPTAGLDPLVQQVFNDLLLEEKAAGTTVFLSSHVLPEVQRVADRVALVREGSLLLVSDVEELRSHAVARVEVTFEGTPPAPEALARIDGVSELERRGQTVLLTLEGEADGLVKELARHHVVTVDSHEADLEDIFMSLYREPRDAP